MDNKPKATDHGLHGVLSHLTGSAVELTGRKADGSPYGPRLLENVSFAPTRSGVSIIGMEPGIGIRQFSLDGVVRMDVITGASETHWIDGVDAKVSRSTTISSDALEALRSELRATLGKP